MAECVPKKNCLEVQVEEVDEARQCVYARVWGDCRSTRGQVAI